MYIDNICYKYGGRASILDPPYYTLLEIDKETKQLALTLKKYSTLIGLSHH